MNSSELKINDIVRWNGRLYDLRWIKPSSGLCKIHNPNTSSRARIVYLNEVQFVGRPIKSKTDLKRFYKKYYNRLV